MLAHPLHSRRIVLVEDDEVLQKHLDTLLRRSFADLDVRGAKDAADALRLLEDESSRLLITDASNVHLDGMAVLATARKLRPTLPVIVMSDSGSERPATMPPLTAASWLEKPPKAERLVGMVKRILNVPLGFTGEINVEGLADLVQLLSMASASGALHVEHGNKHGSLWFEHGSIVDAALEGAHGATVVHQMLRWQGGQFALDRDAHAEQRSIHVPAMQLLLEGVQLIDEENEYDNAVRDDVKGPTERRNSARSSTSQVRLRPVLDAQMPSKRVEVPAQPSPLDELSTEWTTPEQRAAESFQRGMELALHKHYAAALKEWERATALDPANRTYQVNLRRLHEVKRRSAAMGETHGDEE